MKMIRFSLCLLLINGGYGCAVSQRINRSIGPADAGEFNQYAKASPFTLGLKDGRKMRGKDASLEAKNLNPVLRASLYIPENDNYDNPFQIPVDKINNLELAPQHQNSHGIGLLEGAGIGLGTGLGIGLIILAGDSGGGGWNSFGNHLAAAGIAALGTSLGMMIGLGVGRDEVTTRVFDFSGYKAAAR